MARASASPPTLHPWAHAARIGVFLGALLAGCGGSAAPPSTQPSTTAPPPSPSADTVPTQQGPVQGRAYEGGVEFLGIPFARAPVGPLRWRAPVDAPPRLSVLSALAYRPACPQMRFEQGQAEGTLEGDEDCLYLNVWTPGPRAQGLPVLVFVHGGGHQQGGTGQLSAGTRLYDGRNMATRGQAVVVTIAYRLGPLGFLVHPGLEAENAAHTAGNYGAMDQIKALKWVQANIGNFGGDPNRITIFGQSAGGVDVGNLLVAPSAKGLFQRAAIHSAVPQLGGYEEARTAGIAFIDRFAATGSDTQKIASARALDWRPLIATETNPVPGGVVQMNWRPVLDRQVFPLDPDSAFQSGRYNRVPLLIGSTADESSLGAPAVVSPPMVTALLTAAVPAPLRPQAFRLYPPGQTADQARHSLVQVLTDSQFTSPVRRSARAIAAAATPTATATATEPVWRYFFAHHHAGPQAAFGAYHGIDLFYLFNNWENSPVALFTAADAAVQSQMLAYWVQFARTGNPNGTGLPHWPRYAGGTDCYLQLTATPDGSACGLRTEESDLWDAVRAGLPARQ